MTHSGTVLQIPGGDGIAIGCCRPNRFGDHRGGVDLQFVQQLSPTGAAPARSSAARLRSPGANHARHRKQEQNAGWLAAGGGGKIDDASTNYLGAPAGV